MRERVEQILGTDADGPWIGTFHGLCLRMLRRDGERVGLAPNFAHLRPRRPGRARARGCSASEGVDDTGRVRARRSSRASAARRTRMETPRALEARAFAPDAKLHGADLRAVRRGAEARERGGLRRHPAPGALDCSTRRSTPDVRERYAQRCQHLLVDEYQDTNRPQYLLDQGADLGPPQRLRRRRRGPVDLRVPRRRDPQHPRLRARPPGRRGRQARAELPLDRRRSSTPRARVIANNTERKGKTLWTENTRGDEHRPLPRAGRPRGGDVGRARVTRRQRDGAPTRTSPSSTGPTRSRARSKRRSAATAIPTRSSARCSSTSGRRSGRPGLPEARGRTPGTTSRSAGSSTFRRAGSSDTTVRCDRGRARAPRRRCYEAARRLLAATALDARAPRAMLEAFLEITARVHGARRRTSRRGRHRGHPRDGRLRRRTSTRATPGEGLDRMDNVRSLVSAAVEYEREVESTTLLGFLDRSALVSDADEIGGAPRRHA